MDPFNQDFNKADNLQAELSGILTERTQLVSKGQTTGRVDYRLKSGIESLKQELKSMEKISYLYSNDNSRYKNVSQSEKNKRIAKIATFKEKSDNTILEIQKTFGMQSTKNLLDLEGQIDSTRKPLRDKNGEYSHTGAMNTQELI